MWPLWLWLPWFWAVQPQTAPHSTPPLVSPALQDHGLTTVSPAAVSSHRLILAFLDAELPCQAELEKPRFRVFPFLQIPWCVRAVLPLGSVCFLEPACHATKVLISPYLDNNSVGPATAATTQSTHTVSTYSQPGLVTVLSTSLE